MLGKRIKDFPQLKQKRLPYVAVKEAVFPFNMFPEVDPVLGPEMRATGEVMGIATTFGPAFYKAEEAAGSKLPESGNVLITVSDKDKSKIAPIAKELHGLGFTIYTTIGTSHFLNEKSVPNKLINKLNEGRPDIADAIKNKEIDLIINTPKGRESKEDDSYIRRMAIQYKVPYITTLAAAKASVEGIKADKASKILPKALQDYYKDLEKSEKKETVRA
jgi:carbamoyl-phosphate synthase large subunit